MISADYFEFIKHFILIVQGQAKYFWQNCLINNNFSTVVHLRLPHTFLVVTKLPLFGILGFRFEYILYPSILFALRCIIYHGLEATEMWSIVSRASYSIEWYDLIFYCRPIWLIFWWSVRIRNLTSDDLTGVIMVKCISQKLQ